MLSFSLVSNCDIFRTYPPLPANLLFLFCITAHDVRTHLPPLLLLHPLFLHQKSFLLCICVSVCNHFWVLEINMDSPFFLIPPLLVSGPWGLESALFSFSNVYGLGK
jgi:hypothetical protein